MAEIDVQDLRDRLIQLEVSMKEKWESHDKRADERWADLMEKMHEVSHKSTPCSEHIKLMTELNARIKRDEEEIVAIEKRCKEYTDAVELRVKFIETCAWASVGVVVIGGIILFFVKHIFGALQ